MEASKDEELRRAVSTLAGFIDLTESCGLDDTALRQLPEVEIMPGMPVEILIKTGKFTVAHYVMRPVLDSFNRAFREN